MPRPTWLALICVLAAGCGDDGGNKGEAAPAARNDAAPAAAARAGSSLFDGLAQSADHSTFANAVKAAGLAETLSGAQPYTLFAPTDAAFRALPAGTMNTLLAPDEKGRLTAMIANHIVPGSVTAADLARAIERGKGKARLATVGGTTLLFARSGEATTVADPGGGRAEVSGVGAARSNGVLHSLDAVLLPAQSDR